MCIDMCSPALSARGRSKKTSDWPFNDPVGLPAGPALAQVLYTQLQRLVSFLGDRRHTGCGLWF